MKDTTKNLTRGLDLVDRTMVELTKQNLYFTFSLLICNMFQIHFKNYISVSSKGNINLTYILAAPLIN